MHDPDTVAFELRYPWRAYREPRDSFEETYRRPWLTIWHHDPCVRGDDDSCGWSARRLTDADEKWIAAVAADIKFLVRDDPSALDAQVSSEGTPMWEWLWLQRTAYHANPKRRRGLSAADFARISFEGGFPGGRDDKFAYWRQPPEDVARMFVRRYLRLTRPWWQHPRFHFWHWQLQLHPWQEFRRWLLTRCETCGQRFTPGHSAISLSWHSPAPRFLRGERGLYHNGCRPSATPGQKGGST